MSYDAGDVLFSASLIVTTNN